MKSLPLIIKGDVDGSIEALTDSLLKLSKPDRIPKPGDILANINVKNTKGVYSNFFVTLMVSMETTKRYNNKIEKYIPL